MPRGAADAVVDAAARPADWTMAAINLAGCVLFGISAVGAFTAPASGQLVSLSWDDWGCALTRAASEP